MLLADGSQLLSGSSTVNTFAWQVGTGFTYQLSDRVTFDTGYRFFAMSPGTTPLSISGGPFFQQPIGSYTSAFSASELLVLRSENMRAPNLILIPGSWPGRKSLIFGF